MKNTDYILYLDMDGVLVNYARGWSNVAKKTGLRTLNSSEDKYTEEELAPIYNNIAIPDFWRNLDWEPGGKELFKISNQLFEKVHILTSTGSKDDIEFHEIVSLGKMQWIKDNIGNQLNVKNIHIVDEGIAKAEFATPLSILVDDNLKTIEAFDMAGGYGILHKSSKYQETILELVDLSSPLTLGEVLKQIPIIKRKFWNQE
jgi:5'(3')-deoxyribonucleotidase